MPADSSVGVAAPVEHAPVRTVGRRVLLVAAVAVFAVLTFPSPEPVAASTSLDFSWISGLNEAVRRHLVFGREIVYTYGPLAFVAWPLDVGGNLAAAVAFRLVIHALFCLGIALGLVACRDVVFASLFVAGIALSGVARDTEYVFVIAVLIFVTVAALQHRPLVVLPAALLTAVALLVKFNLGVTCLLAVSSWLLVQLPSGDWRRWFGLPLILSGALGVATFLVLFRVYGGPLDALPDYFRNSLLLASGYSGQLSLPGPAADYWFAGLLTALVVGTALERAFRVDRRFLIILFLLAAPLFMTFKGGFVRQDSWHVWAFMEALAAFSCLLLLIPCDRSRRIPVGVMVLLVLGIAMYWHGHQSLPNSFRPLLPQGPKNLLALARWPTEREAARTAFEQFRGQQALPRALLARIGDAPIDVYPLATSLVVANGLNWSPRLVFQSHIAYTPELDEANAEHYRSLEGPRFVLCLAAAGADGRGQAIDDQHPMAVDPLTWLELYRWYDTMEWIGQVGVLERRPTPRCGAPVSQGRCSLALGKRWQLPNANPEPLLLRARFRLTRWGAIRDKLFKVYPPTMTVDYKSGATVAFRIVWRNVANGFLVSDLPLTAGEMESFWRRGVGAPVKSISFQANRQCFEGAVDLEWLTLPAAGSRDQSSEAR